MAKKHETGKFAQISCISGVEKLASILSIVLNYWKYHFLRINTTWNSLNFQWGCQQSLITVKKIEKSQNLIFFKILRFWDISKAKWDFWKIFFEQCDRIDHICISNTVELKIIKCQNFDILAFYIIKIFQHFQTSHNFANTMGLCTTRLLTKCKKPHPIIIICFRDTVKIWCLFIKL